MRLRRLAIPLVAVLFAGPPVAGAQEFRPRDRERGLVMLRTVREDVERHYYDSTFHGVDLAARWDSAAALIATAQANAEVFGFIAWALDGLGDSHTLFVPPGRVADVDYGWDLQMVGDSCYVVGVQASSDAATQGLAPGDRVLRIGQIVPHRRNFWQLTYWLNTLSPQAAVRFAVRSPGGEERQITAKAKVTVGRRVLELARADGADYWDLIRKAETEGRTEFQFVEFERRALVWHMPTFDVSDGDLDRAMRRADDFPALVLDLRGNHGGLERALRRLLGMFFERPDTIATLRRRTERRALVTDARRRFRGSLIVVVDSRSSSAAEVFAHAIKMRERGIVVGDRTNGSVMRSMIHSHQVGAESVVYYSVSVADADIVMADGSRLEGMGVAPNVVLLPTAADIAAGRDPALALALELVGVEVSPEEAGRLFRTRR